MGNSDSCFSEEECPMCRRETEEKVCMNPYIWFYLDVYKELAPQTVKEIGIEAGRRWRTMTKEEKERYTEIAQQRRNIHYLQSRTQNKSLRGKLGKTCRAMRMKRKKARKRSKETNL